MNGLNELYILPWPQSRLSPLSLHKYSLPQTTAWGTSPTKVAALHSGLCSLENGDPRYLLERSNLYSSAQHLEATKKTQVYSVVKNGYKVSQVLRLLKIAGHEVLISKITSDWLKPQPVCLVHTRVQVHKGVILLLVLHLFLRGWWRLGAIHAREKQIQCNQSPLLPGGLHDIMSLLNYQ